MLLFTSTRAADAHNNWMVMKIFEVFLIGGTISWVDELAGLTEFVDVEGLDDWKLLSLDVRELLD